MGKVLALSALVVQNALLELAMRYSRVHADPRHLYLATTAVVSSEVIKLVCASLLLLHECHGSVVAWGRTVWTECVVDWATMLRLLIPSILYTLQNNLAFVASTHLSLATFQVLYQFKIVTTAALTVLFLGKHLTVRQWFAILLLTAGVAAVQLTSINVKDTITSHVAAPILHAWLDPNTTNEVNVTVRHLRAEPVVVRESVSDSSTDSVTEWGSLPATTVGFVAVMAACVTSGFAGVYFEKVLKGSNASIWLRNIQLACIGIVFGLAGVYSQDGDRVRADGFFHGYTPVTWLVVILQACGGLIVAMVVKHADNVLKGFATSVSILISCVASTLVFGTILPPMFLLGTFFVVSSVVLYSWSESK